MLDVGIAPHDGALVEGDVDQPAGLAADQNLPGLRLGLQPGRQVRRGADDAGVLSDVLLADIPGDHQAGVNADPDLQGGLAVAADRRVQVPDGLDDLQPGRRRPPGIVLMGDGIAEVDQQTVAQIAGDDPVPAAQHPLAGLAVELDHDLQVLGIELERKRRRPGEVAEHDGQLPAFRAPPMIRGIFARGLRAGARLVQLRAAGSAKGVVDGVSGAAARAGLQKARAALTAEAILFRIPIPARGTSHSGSYTLPTKVCGAGLNCGPVQNSQRIVAMRGGRGKEFVIKRTRAGIY